MIASCARRTAPPAIAASRVCGETPRHRSRSVRTPNTAGRRRLKPSPWRTGVRRLVRARGFRRAQETLNVPRRSNGHRRQWRDAPEAGVRVDGVARRVAPSISTTMDLARATQRPLRNRACASTIDERPICSTGCRSRPCPANASRSRIKLQPENDEVGSGGDWGPIGIGQDLHAHILAAHGEDCVGDVAVAIGVAKT